MAKWVVVIAPFLILAVLLGLYLYYRTDEQDAEAAHAVAMARDDNGFPDSLSSFCTSSLDDTMDHNEDGDDHDDAQDSMDSVSSVGSRTCERSNGREQYPLCYFKSVNDHCNKGGCDIVGWEACNQGHYTIGMNQSEY
jgi:hypothetical protein